MLIFNRRFNEDNLLANFIVGYFFFQAINSMVKLGFGDFAGWEILVRGILAILLAMALIPILYRKFLVFVLWETCCVMVFMESWFLGNIDPSVFNPTFFNAITVFIPMAVSFLALKDSTILLKRFYLFAWPSLVVLAFTMIHSLANFNHEYSMSGGYSLLLWFLVLADHFLETHSITDVIGCCIAFLLILFAGSRGPMICIACFIAIKLLFSRQLSLSKRIMFFIILLSCALIMYLFYVQILTFLLDIATKFGFSGRSISLFLSDLGHDSGRLEGFKEYSYLIHIRPLLGYGVASWFGSGGYPHNIFIEFLYSFGVILGPILFLTWIGLLIRGLLQRNIANSRLFHILLSISAMFLVSGTFTTSPIFFLGLGVCTKKRD
ncbi:MAG: hypothetical protein J6Y17_02860 [Elusimicrobiaceae bacterium]|nr:hypothetical protein [Elusimicrobiaceae bacterium]